MAGGCWPCLPRRSNSDRVVSGFVAVHATNGRVLSRLPTGALNRRASTRTQRKTVYLVRHAEALHNVQEKNAQEEVRRLGGAEKDVEAARHQVLLDKGFLDAELSPGGEAQVSLAHERFAELLERTHYPVPEVVFVSPLHRTLKTALLLFPGHESVHALEFLREKRTGLPCDERKPASEIREDFPCIDISDIERLDSNGCDGYAFRPELKEDNEAVRSRTSELLDFLLNEPSESIAVVTHKGLLRELSRGPLAAVLDPEGGQLPAVFGNAEVRVCEVTWGSDGATTVKARSLEGATMCPPMAVCDLSRKDERRTSRRLSPGIFSKDRTPSKEGVLSGSCRSFGFVSEEPNCVPAGNSLRVAIGSSQASEPGEAAVAAWRQMEERLGGPPTFALVAGGGAGTAIAAALKPHTGNAYVVGCSSPGGVLVPGGLGGVGILGLRDLVWRCGVGAHAGADGPNARKASASAAQQATQGRVPDLLFLCVAPGSEEHVLQGIHDVCGDVPIFGGSSGSCKGSGEPTWQLHGSSAGWGSHTDGVVVAALWLYSNAAVSCLLSHCFAPTERKGKITSASGRLLSEIDSRPAAEVLDEWMGGSLGSKAPGDKLLETALCPLALQQRSGLRLLQAKELLPGGIVACGGQVHCGNVRFLRLKPADLVGALAAVAREALERAPFEVLGAVFCVCACCTLALDDLQVLADALPAELPEYFCFFTAGEQGMIDGVACHGNLMVNVMLLG